MEGGIKSFELPKKGDQKVFCSKGESCFAQLIVE